MYAISKFHPEPTSNAPDLPSLSYGPGSLIFRVLNLVLANQSRVWVKSARCKKGEYVDQTALELSSVHNKDHMINWIFETFVSRRKKESERGLIV